MELLADSVTGFSGTQGLNNWSYGYWDRSADADRTYNAETDFRHLQHFGDDPVNGLSTHSAFTTGPLWYQEDGVYYTSLWAEGGHPNAVLDLGDHAPVEHWAVRRWESTVDGVVTISGHAGKVMPWGANWSGGCTARIVVDSELVYSTPIDNNGAEYSTDVTVSVGSSVDFLIGPGPSIGVSMFTATVRRQRAPQDAERSTVETGPHRRP